MSFSLLDHFEMLMLEIRSHWDKDETRIPGSEMLKKVGKIYNDPKCILFFLNDPERYKDTLSFVLYYYYHAWNTYGLSDRKDLDAWLSALMGGNLE